jgi:hypothetical protein
MQGEIIFHLSDLAYDIRAIKFVHLNSRKTRFTMKVVGMKILGIGGVVVFMAGTFFRGGRVQGLAHPFVELGFEGVKAAIEGSILVIEVLNFGIGGTNVGIDVQDVTLVLIVVGDQVSDFLVTGESHL